ncbi:energy-coupling factor transporter transmembrane component T [Oceanobacillus saliphilus]|uniref:energy-coupling factor transporter transmembrane component T n=1 Tax=Oceanobacillus saliphilus TaxID=2925834 RepID=UPI00201E3FED|nr:energy-coupling factor transporter transmembrane component T [Oceanobacillus saliphilus]
MPRGFRSFHPFVLMLYYIAVIAGLMINQHPFFLLAAFICLVFVNLILDKGVELNKWKYMILFLSLFVLVLTPIFNQQGNIVLWTVFSREIYLEAIIQGFMIACTLSGILALFTTFSIVITSDKFLYMFSKVFPKWALILMLALRFVPLFRKRLSDIQDVQEMKGVSMKDGKLREKAQNGMLFIQILLTYSLEEAIQTADSMSARGYGLQKRSNYESYAWKLRDSYVLIYIIAFSLLIIIGWQLHESVLMLAPTLESIALEGNSWFYLIGWISLISLPIWTEGKEVMKWSFYQRDL